MARGLEGGGGGWRRGVGEENGVGVESPAVVVTI